MEPVVDRPLMEHRNGKFYIVIVQCAALSTIILTVPSSVLFNQLVCRQLSSDMNKIAHAIYSFLKQAPIDIPFTIKELNHMVFLAYYDKQHIGKDIKQITMHRDQRWTSGGKFMRTQNSQEQDTATCVLTLGGTRDLSFQCFMDNFTGDKRGSISIDKYLSSHTFSLTHGSLFILHPSDEETFLRNYFDQQHGTYFKHGNVFFGKDGITIGLAFRTTFRSAVVNAQTGQFVLSKNDAAPLKEFQKTVEDYIADSLRKSTDDEKRKELWAQMKNTYFS